MSKTYTKAQYDNMDKKRRFAWGKYFEEINTQADMVPIIVDLIGRDNETGQLVKKEDLPKHITQEYYDMGVKLNKKYTCPICFDLTTKETIAITFCGHIYCKECLETLKAQDEPKCSICRRKL